MITDDDKALLLSFEECSLGAKCWTHAAHVRVGWLILETSFSFEQALERLRTGILRFNSTNDSIGYHETITVAFARLIDTKRVSGDNWLAFSQRNSDLFDKDVLDRFYSRAVLSSNEAREIFIESDLEELPLVLVRDN